MRKPLPKRNLVLPSRSLPVRRSPLPGFTKAPDPCSAPPAGMTDPEAIAKEEISQVAAGFRARKATEDARYKNAIDASYYFVVAFESGNQADAFLQAAGMLVGEGDLFVDGRILADRLNIKLPASTILPARAKTDRKLAALVRK